MTSDETPTAPQAQPPADRPTTSTPPAAGTSSVSRPPAPSGSAGQKAAQRWWPTSGETTPAASAADEPQDVPLVETPAPADVSQAPASDAVSNAGQWWPYAGAAETPVPSADSAVDTSTGEPDDPDDSVPPETAASDDDAPVQPLDPSDVAAERVGGWASFGAAQTAEDVLDRLSSRDAWSDSATGGPPRDRTSAPLEQAPEPAPEPVVEEPAAQQPAQQPEPADEEPAAEATGPVALDVPATTHWSLDDFESYIRQQGTNELSSWMGDRSADTPEPESPVAESPTVDELPPAEPAATPTPYVEAPVSPPPVAAAPELYAPATTHDTDEPAYPDAPEGAWAQPDVAWEAPAAPEQPPAADAGSPSEPSGWDPDATEYFDWVVTDEPEPDDAAAQPAQAASLPAVTLDKDEPEPTMVALPVVSPPAAIEAPAAEPVTPEHVVVPDAGDQLEAEIWQDEGGTDDAEHDHQEWFDDQGLRWVSDDGGYTWFSDDGQGWNAEIGEAIEPASGERAPTTVAPVTDAAPAATESAAPLFRDEVAPQDAPPAEPWPEAPAGAPLADEVWPTGAGATAASAQAPPPSGELWPAASTPEPTSAPVTQQAPAVTVPPAAAADEPIPPFVEYKPRGAYRPLLGVLFVAAAILAVVAIFWAVSKGSQTATGIAVGVTGFALAFWWGLLSWTPTIVSLSGSILEVARGQDGERFDLRSPRLVIDVDEDVTSRNWRTTITRPNGTELVIPASAVDPEEFSRIVTHYRAQAHAPGA